MHPLPYPLPDLLLVILFHPKLDPELSLPLLGDIQDGGPHGNAQSCHWPRSCHPLHLPTFSFISNLLVALWLSPSLVSVSSSSSPFCFPSPSSSLSWISSPLAKRGARVVHVFHVGPWAKKEVVRVGRVGLSTCRWRQYMRCARRACSTHLIGDKAPTVMLLQCNLNAPLVELAVHLPLLSPGCLLMGMDL